MTLFKTKRRPVADWCDVPRRYAVEDERLLALITIDLDSIHRAPCGGRGWAVIEDWDGHQNDFKGICEHVIEIGD
jgi:hypothetical protein